MSGETTDQLRGEALTAMAQRGLNNVEALLEPVTREVYEVVLDACRWFDEQGGRVGTGVLANEIRARLERGRQPTRTRSVLEEQREYGEQIAAWLSEHLPDLDRPRFGPHPAAVAEVIRLHWRHGKQWGPPSRAVATQIRRAVKGFERQWGPDTSDQQEVTR